MKTLVSLFIRPAEAFYRLKSEEKFPVAAFVALLTLTLAYLILNVPITTKISLLTLSNMEGLPEAQAEAGMQLVYNMRFLTVAGLFIMELVFLLLNALALFIVMRVAGMKIPFGKVANLIILCSLVLVIGALVNTALLYVRGIEAIGSPYDLQLTSLNLLFPAAASSGMTLYTFLGYLSPFQLWFVALVVWGVKIVTEASLVKSLAVGIVYWLITVGVPVASAWLSESAMQKFGIN